MRRILIPYVVYMAVSLVYFSHYVPDVRVDHFFGTKTDLQGAVLRMFILIYAVQAILVELKQIVEAKFLYFTSFWNNVYLFSKCFAIFIVVEHGCKTNNISHETIIQLASFQTVILWLMVFYWVRVFPELAFYVKMITETMVDIFYFMIMLILVIMMFANGMYVLNRASITNYAEI